MAIARKTWGSRRTSLTRDPKRKRELFLHHEAGAVARATTEANERRAMRALQSFHMDRNGWADIGYNYVLFPSGRLYEARGFSAIPAAQGGHNSGTIAICCIGHYDKQKLTEAQKKRLVKAANNLAAKGVRTVGGHGEAPGQATACPGKHIRDWLTPLAARSKLVRYGH